MSPSKWRIQIRGRHPRAALAGAGPGIRGLRNLVGGTISLAVLGAIAVATREPFVFPSLGPTAFLIFDVPEMAHSSPRNAVLGHLVGVACAWAALFVTGLLDVPSDVTTGISVNRAIAAALSLGLTSGLMVWARVPHPPACATTLIVGLGILHKPDQLAVLMAAVVALVAIGVIVNRLWGVDYPLWSRRPAAPS